MEWLKVKHTRQEVNAASRVLLDPLATNSDRYLALPIVNNWRASHAFPMNTFQISLKKKTEAIDAIGIVAQRIKRLPAIEQKLRLMPNLQLTQMQDIGGCRAIVSNVSAVKQLVDAYESSRLKHVLVHRNDYMHSPRPTGYRGVHLIYRYFSDKKSDYNGLKVEVQLRTGLQHAWATAVETVGLFTNQPLKSGLGDKKWLRFFALMGSYLSTKEGLPAVPGTPLSWGELKEELSDYVNSLEVIKHLTAFQHVVEMTDKLRFRSKRYLLLQFSRSTNLSRYRLTLRLHSRREAEGSAAGYFAREPRQMELPLFGEDFDTLIVSVDSMNALRQAYPNYFADTSRFVREVKSALKA